MSVPDTFCQHMQPVKARYSPLRETLLLKSREMVFVSILSLLGKISLGSDRTEHRTNNPPSYIDTEMNRSIALQKPGLENIFQNAPPLKRMGTVADLSGGLLYLLSDHAAYVTGLDLIIDGGMSVSVSNGMESSCFVMK